MSKLFCFLRFHRRPVKFLSLSSRKRNLFTSVTHFEDDKKDIEDLHDKRKEAKQKLENLLELMIKDKPNENFLNVNLPRPREKVRKEHQKLKAKHLKRKQQIEENRIGTQLEKAATKIAEALGGDTKKTEMELLELYLKHETKKSNDESSQLEETPSGDEVKTETELLESYLTRKTKQTNDESEGILNLKDILSSLQIDTETRKEQSRAYQVRIYRKSSKVVNVPKTPLSRSRVSNAKRVDIFGAEPLNIFTMEEEKESPPCECIMWNFLQERDLQLSVTHPPNNIFEQLIVWTEQGKIWRFPINNEQDWHETNVDFSEHVFLEHLLEPWCPSSGLIRHFMELVCVGLSKNPYLSVQEKHAHITFYEHYFRQKNNLLVNLGLEPIKDRVERDDQLQQAIM